jgi:hypothetical protein
MPSKKSFLRPSTATLSPCWGEESSLGGGKPPPNPHRVSHIIYFVSAQLTKRSIAEEWLQIGYSVNT